MPGRHQHENDNQRPAKNARPTPKPAPAAKPDHEQQTEWAATGGTERCVSFVHVVRDVVLRFGFAEGGEIEKKEGCSVARPPAAPSPTQDLLSVNRASLLHLPSLLSVLCSYPSSVTLHRLAVTQFVALTPPLN